MGKELFGTDGIRGVAGEYPLDRRTAYAVGVALARWVRRHGASQRVVIGMDTRESGPWLGACVAGGLREGGVTSHLAGVVTTPGIAYLTRTGDFVAGVMISASHNPYEDNGIKIFDHSGYKAPDDDEHELEQEVFRLLARGGDARPDHLEIEAELDETYLAHLARNAPELRGVRIAVDCGNGAASELAPGLLGRLGAEVHAMADTPDGRNINRNCGALHVAALRRLVIETNSDLGVAYDGDADRAIFVTGAGRIVDGDGVLLLCARRLLARGGLTGGDGEPLVVATVMSNLGLEQALRESGITMTRTPVGDKYVLEEMRRRNAALGGEQSGHVIFRELATTGDGLLTTLQVLAGMKETGCSLDELTADLEIYPQVLLNIRVKRRKPLRDLPAVQEAIHCAEAAFADSGRVLVRFSGTEPLARVMVEGEDASAVDHHAHLIAAAIRDSLSG